MKTVKTNRNWLIKTILISLIVLGCGLTSHAQYISIKLNPVSDLVNMTKLKLNNQPTEETNTCYINASLLFFEKNLRMCKDLISQPDTLTKKSIDPVHTKKEAPSTEAAPEFKTKKKINKIWNYPGNTNSRI